MTTATCTEHEELCGCGECGQALKPLLMHPLGNVAKRNDQKRRACALAESRAKRAQARLTEAISACAHAQVSIAIAELQWVMDEASAALATLVEVD